MEDTLRSTLLKVGLTCAVFAPIAAFTGLLASLEVGFDPDSATNSDYSFAIGALVITIVTYVAAVACAATVALNKPTAGQRAALGILVALIAAPALLVGYWTVGRA